MIGQNVILLCPADMQIAVQYYLNTVVFRDSTQVEVKQVEHFTDADRTGFNITMVPQKKEIV